MIKPRLVYFIGFCIFTISLLSFVWHLKSVKPIVPQRNYSLELSSLKHFSKNYPAIDPKLCDHLATSADFFVIEPNELKRALGSRSWHRLVDRFHLPETLSYNLGLLQLGTFGYPTDDVSSKIARLVNSTSLVVNSTILSTFPFTGTTRVSHIFLSSPKYSLTVQIVVFYPTFNFLWVGLLPNTLKITDGNYQFGADEAIFDSFGLDYRLGWGHTPRDVRHFLSQLPTAHFVHCPDQRQGWLAEHNLISASTAQLTATEEVITGLKRLARDEAMEVWLACGTLLGWRRQCSITPYTTDTDFGTWSRYAKPGLTTKLQSQVKKNPKLNLWLRFGEVNSTLEYTFRGRSHGEKVDLFFFYNHNSTHLKTSVHNAGSYRHLFYPRFRLCSAVLLGHKVLVPCQLEALLIAEYGPNFMEPVTKWNYASDSKNQGPLINFKGNVDQMEHF